MQARFDKRGRQLPGTGHGCGCQLCAADGAPRYERRHMARAAAGDTWSTLRRGLVRLARAVHIPGRPEVA